MVIVQHGIAEPAHSIVKIWLHIKTIYLNLLFLHYLFGWSHQLFAWKCDDYASEFNLTILSQVSVKKEENEGNSKANIFTFLGSFTASFKGEEEKQIGVDRSITDFHLIFIEKNQNIRLRISCYFNINFLSKRASKFLLDRIIMQTKTPALNFAKPIQLQLLTYLVK